MSAVVPRIYRLSFTLATLVVAAEALGAGRKWQ
jgi:hypothetical protein